ncbi:ataxin-2-like protein [Diplodia corticola]|uniref:Ataxin-2-like protein n=1 Tax=Diplodia corticola TaxID=236234 RepID=A0A1J9R558_9PEZI|nr:ataxin-2-like protein [Diplodia corticola]OJD35362.1 ataxin-2-like protein [Diplodia corticola]
MAKSYREALLTRPRQKQSKANFVFTVQDDNIRENIRYRIYDFCFDIVYDDALRPSIMQYIRVLYLPPHPLFNRENWEKTMVHRHWSHKPRGLALLRVASNIYREVFFRFYWFHLPNWALPFGDIPDLRRRLRKIPEPHDRNVNAHVKIRCFFTDEKESENARLNIVRPSTLREIFYLMGLGDISIPWVSYTNVDGKKEKIIIGVGFQILQELTEENWMRSLTFVGKLGNMVFRPSRNGVLGGLDFAASKYQTAGNTAPAFPEKRLNVKGIQDVFRHMRRHLENATGAIRQAKAYLPPLRTQSPESSCNTGPPRVYQSHGTAVAAVEKRHASENNPQRNLSLASEHVIRASRPASQPEPIEPLQHGQHLSPRSQHSLESFFGQQTRKSQLRGGSLLVLLHELNHHTLDLIDNLEHSNAMSTSRPEMDEKSLMQEMSRCSTQISELITLDEVLRAPPEKYELGALDISRPKSEPDRVETCWSPALHEATEEENGLDNIRNTLRSQSGTHTLSSFQTNCPPQLEEGCLSDHRSTRAEPTHEQSKAYYAHEMGFETRIAQWITRENDPIPSRKSSVSWSSGKEACELSSRKRVSSSNYHVCFSRRPLSNKHPPSSGTAFQSTTSSSSRSTSSKCSISAMTDTLAPQAPTTTIADTSTERQPAPPSQHYQVQSPESIVPTPAPSITDRATTTPPLRELPLSKTTNAQITDDVHKVATAAATTTISSSKSSRRVSSSSNVASLCADDRRPEDEPIIVIPGAKQFLTPKRDVKPWWEASSGGSQSTGGKKRRSGRGKGTRGSADAWT